MPAAPKTVIFGVFRAPGGALYQKIAPAARFFYFSDFFLIRLPPFFSDRGREGGGNLIKEGGSDVVGSVTLFI